MKSFKYKTNMKSLNYKVWKDFCEKTAKKTFVNFAWYHGVEYFSSKYTNTLDKKLSRVSNHAQYNLYMSIGYFFGLKELWRMMEKGADSHYYYRAFYESLCAECIRLHSGYLFDYLEIKCELGNNSSPVSFINSLKELDDNDINTRELFLKETTSKGYLFDYMDDRWQVYLWIWLLSTPELREKEIRRLQTLPEETGSRELILHLRSMDMDDEQLTTVINDYSAKSFGGMSVILELSLYIYRLGFSKVIIDWVLQNVPSQVVQNPDEKTKKFISSFCDSVDDYSSRVENNIDLFEKAILHFMPYTVRDYAKILFVKGDYRKWVEVQTFYGNEPLYYHKNEVKLMAKEAPEQLLPLYHQQITREINEKNRKSYKEAVRLLKKLRTIYKKLKMVNAWEQYCLCIQENHKRLRAFQEELREGKIIESSTD